MLLYPYLGQPGEDTLFEIPGAGHVLGEMEPFLELGLLSYAHLSITQGGEQWLDSEVQ